MKYEFTIIRFEGDYAICKLDNGKTVSIPNDIIPIIADKGDKIELIVTKAQNMGL